jgi:hypothetical protein
MEAGMAGTGAASGAGEDDVSPMLLHAPSNTVSAPTAPRLATVRALSDLTMAFPRIKLVAAPIPQPNVKLLSQQ